MEPKNLVEEFKIFVNNLPDDIEGVTILAELVKEMETFGDEFSNLVLVLPEPELENLKYIMNFWKAHNEIPDHIDYSLDCLYSDLYDKRSELMRSNLY